jgi:hypothetical protein
MRRALVILGLCLTAALPAEAQQGKGRLTPAQPSARALELRGAANPDPLAPLPAPPDPLADQTQVAAAADLLGGAPPISSPAGQSQVQMGQCRQACARSYYFCLSADVSGNCASNWNQCRSDCNGWTPRTRYGVRASD